MIGRALSASDTPHDPTAVSWAVFLGCTTGKRLSIEWGISNRAACQRLAHAAGQGLIVQVGRGAFRSPAPGVVDADRLRRHHLGLCRRRARAGDCGEHAVACPGCDRLVRWRGAIADWPACECGHQPSADDLGRVRRALAELLDLARIDRELADAR